MYPDLCGTAGADDVAGTGGTPADDEATDDTGDTGEREVRAEPALLVGAVFPAPLAGGTADVAEGFPAALVTDERTTMVEVSETTEVTLTPELETAPDAPLADAKPTGAPT